MHRFQIDVSNGSELLYSSRFSGAVELGRQLKGEGALFSPSQSQSGDTSRLSIAPHEETSISRQQVRISTDASGRLQLTNISSTNPVHVSGAGPLVPKASIRLDVVTSVQLGPARQLTILDLQPKLGLNALPEATLAPRNASVVGVSMAGLRTRNDTRKSEDLIPALQATIDFFQTAVSRPEFFEHAVTSAVELVGVDSASILLCEEGKWSEPKARKGTQRPASRQVLEHVLRHRRTFWDTGLGDADVPASLLGVTAVIAAPILDREGNVIGAVYCDQRRDNVIGGRRVIEKLDAMLVELLARSVAAGLDRLGHEDAARRMRLQFEQFVSPRLAAVLEANPDLLIGRDVNVTALFCDVSGFSRICENIGPVETFRWMNDVLETLSEIVTRHEGTLVDYVGDALFAMWGAPIEQPDHHARACRAALEMLASLPELNDRWQKTTREPTGLGIGVHSGHCRAGNCGSQYKFKYGPVGSDVNLASRVQGATKFLRVPLLITGATELHVDREFPSRKLCDVRVINIREPVPLHQLMTDSSPATTQLCASYQEALTLFERRDFRRSAALLGSILNEHASDGPSLVLLSRVVKAMIEGPSPDHPVWELLGK